jgi:hypothetical protein
MPLNLLTFHRPKQQSDALTATACLRISVLVHSCRLKSAKYYRIVPPSEEGAQGALVVQDSPTGDHEKGPREIKAISRGPFI